MATGAGEQPGSPGIASKRTLLIGSGIALVALAVLLGVLLLSGDDRGGVATGEESAGQLATTRDSAEQTYPLALYTVTLPKSWDLSTKDEPESAILESVWHSRSSPPVSFWIGARVPATQKRPVRWAESKRAATGRSPTYREIAFGPTSLAGRPAMRWAFDISGKRRVAYFLDECEVGAMIVGSSSPAAFSDHAEDFRRAASSLKVRC